MTISEVPLISVCIPVYNGDNYIRESIDSVFNQTERNFELLVADNCSTDQTLNIVAEYDDPRIRVFVNKRNLGAVAPPDLKLKQLYYLDSAGLIASLGNLILLRKNIPSIKQIKFWDNWFIPLSIKLDPWLRYNVGETIIGVWNKK